MVTDKYFPSISPNQENIMTFYQFVGLDVAKDKFDVALNNKQTRQSFASDKNGLKLFLGWLKKHTITPWVCMEATGHYSELIAEYLDKHAILVSIINPLQIKNFARMKLTRNKNDIIDARLIAEYGYTMQPRAFQPREAAQKELKDLVKLLDTLKEQVVQLKNQLHSTQGRLAKEALHKLIKRLENQIVGIEKQLADLVKESSALQEKIQLITSIKGIGCLTAYKIMAEIPDIHNFQTAKQFAAFMGITPKQNQSGKFRGKTTISRLGNSRLRKALYMAALVAKRYNTHLSSFVARLQAKSKAPKAIVCAVMRKLAHWIFGVLKNTQLFNPKIV
jgi:transposase